jgi:hypothetical protein
MSMQAIKLAVSQPANGDDPVSETTQVHRRVRRRTLAVEQLEYHLFVPHRTHDPLLENAYEVWRDAWRATFEELDGKTELFSDEFTRQDEVGVLSLAGRCIAVTGMRWLDLSLARAREDSYFKPWPAEAVLALGDGIIGISSNAVVHPDWRGSLVLPPPGVQLEPSRLSTLSVGLTIQRFFESPAELSVAVTRNDRGMDRVCSSLGATSLGQTEMHGIDSDVMQFARTCVKRVNPTLNSLWRRRHQS